MNSNEGRVGSSFLRRVLLIETTTIAFGLLLWLAVTLRALLLDILISLILATVLDPLVRIVSKARIRRSLAVVVVVLFGVSTISLLLYIFTRPLYSAGVTFARDLPGLVSQAQSGTGRIGALIRQFHIESYVTQNTSKLTALLGNVTGPALAATRTVLSGITGFVTIALLAVFILLEGPGMLTGVLSFMHTDNALRLRRTIQLSRKAVAGYVLGNLATSLIAGIVVGVTLYILGVPFVLLLGLWVGLVDLLPLVGGLLAGIPTVGVALLHSPIDGLITMAVFIAYQQAENHILNPVIMGKTIKLNPLWILISVLVGVDLAGFLGALIGIPVAAIVQVFAIELWQVFQTRKPLAVDPDLKDDA